MSHLTYAEAIITGIVQGVSELFPISSLGHNVLIPALLGGQWAKDLDVTAKESPYLAFIVGLHVATAFAMIAYFWRDWLRIVRGFFTSIRDRRVADPDQRLAWMIIGGTIPVGLVGLALQKVVTGVFAKPTLTALFLAVNGGILLYSERQRRPRPAGPAGTAGGWEDDRPGHPDDRRGIPDHGRYPDDRAYPDGRVGYPDDGYPDGQGGYPGDRGYPGDHRGYPDDRSGYQPGRGQRGQGPGGQGPGGYNAPSGEERTQVWNQQPGQQQWQGPDPRYEDPRYNDPRYADPRYGQQRDPRRGPDQRDPRYAQEPPAPPQPPTPGQPPAAGQGPSFTPSFTPASQPDPRARMGAAPMPGGGPQAPRFTPAGSGQGAGAGEPPQSVRDDRGSHGAGRPAWEDDPARGRGPDTGRDPRDFGRREDERDFGRQRDPRDPGRRDPRGRRPAGRDFDGARDFGADRDFNDRPDRHAGGENEGNVAADRRLATMTFKQAVLVGAWQIAALLPGISRDGIVTVGGMRKGMRREDAVRYSFLLSAPVILAAGVLKLGDLTGPEAKGIMGPVILGSLLAFVGAYFSVRFLTKYFSESKSLKPFGIYCLAFGILSFLFLTVVR